MPQSRHRPPTGWGRDESVDRDVAATGSTRPLAVVREATVAVQKRPLAMILRDAESICASQAAKDAWKYIKAHRQSFI
jgi:hypothetical protein